MEAMERRSLSALDDPARAAVAWRRYRRLMAWMGLVTIAVIGLALAYLRGTDGPLGWTEVIATVLGVGFTMLVGTGLMLLLFLSHGTGHDDEVQQRLDESGW